MSSGLLAALLVAGSLLCLRAAVLRSRRTSATRNLVAAPAPVRPEPPSAPQWFVERLAATGVSARPDLLWRAWLVTAATGPALCWWTAGPGLGGLALVIVATAPPLAWHAGRGRAAARLQTALPPALEAVARSLRSGAGLRAAVAEAAAVTPGPLGADLAGVARTAEASGMVAALDGWGESRRLPGVRLAVAALCLGAETGGAQARAIDGVAVTLRQRLGTIAEARALASQARASAAVIALAPLAFCGLTSATDPRVAAFLFRSGAGIAVLSAGLLLDTLGALWMARLTRPAP